MDSPDIEPVEGTVAPDPYDDPDRLVTFGEFRLLSEAFTTRVKQEAAKSRTEARDRLIGWVLVVVFFVSIGWLAFGQIESEHELRQSLYDTCVASQAERTETARFYREIGELTRHGGSDKFRTLLEQAVTRLEQPRDCAAKYLP